MDSNQEIIIKYIQENLLSSRGEIELSDDDDLLGSGLVDSMGIMKLVAFIEDRFKKSIPPEDIVIENFKDVKAIADYLEN